MSPREPSDDELDRLLEQARWPAPRIDQLARLDDRWRRLRRRRRQWQVAGLAAAASLLVAAGIGVWIASHAPQAPLVAQREPAQQEMVDAPPSQAHAARPDVPPPLDAGPPVEAERAVVARAPNTYEQVVLAATMPPPVSRDDDEEIEPIETWVERLAEDPQADVDERTAKRLVRHERMLWKMVRGGDETWRLGAARLLSRMGTRRSLGVLEELLVDPATHGPAVLGLGRLVDEVTLARLAASEPAAELRKQLLAELAARDTDEAVGLYLGFVRDPRSAGDAVLALGAARAAPVDRLFAYLENPQPAVRMAAAQALGSLADPAVIDRLGESLSGVGRTEALFALLSSPSARAAQHVRRARHDLYLVATVRAAEQQLSSQLSLGGGQQP